MKSKYILFLLILSSSFCISQDCLVKGITFTSQTEVDSFISNYPHCKIINGNLLIPKNSSVNNLDSLKNIVQIKGSLHISSDSLLNLNGLQNLRYVENRFILNGCHNLINLNGLQNLVSTGDFKLLNNDSISTIEHLQNLKYVNGEFAIIKFNGLTSLFGLDSLMKIGAHLSIGWNEKLEDISSLKKLTEIGGILELFHNDKLKSLNGLGNLNHISIDELYIQNNSILDTCNTTSICNYLDQNIGYYELFGNNENCNSQDNILQGCDLTTIIEYDQNNNPIFYPNPTNRTLHFENLNLQDISIYSAIGNLVNFEILDNNSISILNIRPGIYAIYSKSKSKVIGRLVKY